MSSVHVLIPQQLRMPEAAQRDLRDASDHTRHDVDVETAIESILRHEGPILVDLDETLYLRNSTEDFIDTARPGLLALILLRVLDVIKPWRWSGGEKTRDVWRVAFVRAFFPWVSWQWRKRTMTLAKSFANAPLLQAIRTRNNVIIATVGFQPIVAPLVAALGLSHIDIIAARLSTFEDRKHGKLALATGRLGQDVIRRSLVVTDSLDDIKLLDACARPLRVIWPQARYRPAFSRVYMPGQYLTQVKRPGERYIIRGILQEDFAFWILSSIALATNPALHIIGLGFLLLSFWAVYERGYVANDLAAARYEAQPKLSAEFKEAPVATPQWRPWLWAALSGALAIFILRVPNAPQASDFAAWLAVLVATYGWFEIYNRFDKLTRVWLFSGLQFARVAAFAVLVPVLPIGAVALGAHAVAKWVPYYVYRLGNKAWPEMPFHLMRLMFFIVLSVLLAASQGLSLLLNWSALALLAWNLYRAKSEIATAWSNARRLDRHSDSTPNNRHD